MIVKFLGAVLLLGASLLPAPALAQATGPVPTVTETGKRPPTDDFDALRTDLRHTRREAVAGRLMLTADEGARFWPLYDQYAHDLTEIKDTQYQLIDEYVHTYGRYDDTSAMAFITRWVELDVRTTALRARYAPLVDQVLPGLKAATFFQIDRRISLEIDLRLAMNLSVLTAQRGN